MLSTTSRGRTSLAKGVVTKNRGPIIAVIGITIIFVVSLIACCVLLFGGGRGGNDDSSDDDDDEEEGFVASSQHQQHTPYFSSSSYPFQQVGHGVARPPRVVMTCFAGRRDYMKILIRYLDRLIENGLVHAVHFWNFTREPEDEKWLLSWAEETAKPQDVYKVMSVKNKKSWIEYYEHYTQGKGTLYHDDDVIVKVDDDVVFIDVCAFRSFIERRRQNPQYLFAFPNIINNGVCAYYQAMYGFTEGHFEIKELPYDTFYGKVVMDGGIARRLHKMFCDGFQKLTRRARALEQPIVVHKMGDRISINCFAVLGKDLDVFLDIGFDDEHDSTVEITKLHKRQHYIDMSMFVCHGAFGTQRSKLGDPEIQDMYTRVAERALSMECYNNNNKNKKTALLSSSPRLFF